MATLTEVLAELKSLGNDKVRAHNTRNGAGENQFGVKLGDIRKIALRIKSDDMLADALWDTGNLDARLLAILLLKPKTVPRDVLDRMVRSANQVQLADWLNAYIVREHPRPGVAPGIMDGRQRPMGRSRWLESHFRADRPISGGTRPSGVARSY